jgi:hypothetical protein
METNICFKETQRFIKQWWILILLLTIILNFSCKPQQFITQENINGYFYGKTNGYSTALRLKNDSTFIYVKSLFEGSASCTGKWKMENNIIILQCIDRHEFQGLVWGYMGEVAFSLKTVNKNKLANKKEKVRLKKSHQSFVENRHPLIKNFQ